MTEIVLTASKGVMDNLLAKLSELIGDRCADLIGVPNDTVFLQDELRTMNALLEKLKNTDELDPLVTDWRDQVRETAYDIEDCIDEFVHVCNARAKAGFIKKISHFVTTLRARLETAKQIKELKTRLQEINERRKRYKFDDCFSSSSSVAVDPRLPALYKEEANLVGIDGPRDELVTWTMDEDPHLKVMAIVGFGGLGKTTLANQVYNTVRPHFDCQAFISVSQKPDIRNLLNNILSKFRWQESSHVWEMKDLIDNLREYLQHKRYFVAVDDLWDAPTWDIICSAFPENGRGSRVLVTTRVKGVATWACCNHHQYIYKVKPLNDQDSRRLFLSRIFGSEVDCPSHFREVSAEILKKCGGLPLAVITIASLLACQPARLREEWESIQNSLCSQFGTNPTLEGMMKILDLSYKNLPHHLRTCLLYLAIYPEDHVIRRDDLIKQWVAEGFVSNLHGCDLEEVAKSYFNELVNRSLIQPGSTRCREVLTCRVHDMMLDLILRKCAEHNFISVAYSLEEMAGLHGSKVRRLSLNNFGTGDVPNGETSRTISTSLPKVRSLAQFGEYFAILPLSRFKFLRVLVFELKYAHMEGMSIDLTVIHQLLHLRYLKVRVPIVQTIELPTEIQGLVHLKTMQIDTYLELPLGLPSDIVHLPRLSYLSVPFCCRYNPLPDGIGKMQSLCTLVGFDLMGDIKGLGELTNLRNLTLYLGLKDSCDISETTRIDALVSSLGELQNLRYIEVRPLASSIYDDDDLLGSLSHSPLQLEQLLLSGWRLPRVPRWIGGNLRNLSRLELRVLQTSTDEVCILGELPYLIHLMLHVELGPQGRATVIFGTGKFPSLEDLHFHCGGDAMSYLRFEAGVMPNLRRLNLGFNEWDWGGTTPVGMEHLLSLQNIHVTLRHDTETTDGRVARAFANYAAQEHPCRPSFTINDHRRRRSVDYS